METTGEISPDSIAENAVSQGYIDIPVEEDQIPITVNGVLRADGRLPEDHPMHGRTFLVSVENQLQVALIDVEEIVSAKQADGEFPERHLFRSDVAGFSGQWTDACYPSHVANPTSFPVDGPIGQQLSTIVQQA